MAALRRVTDHRGLDMAPFEIYEKTLRKRVDQGKIPGYCSAVIYQGELLHADAYGQADPERGLKYGPDVLMRLYCMSKPFVAVAILLLQDRGRLSVQDPVSKYIPSFRKIRVASHGNSVMKTHAQKPKALTILRCLTHTAGLPYGRDFNQTPDSAETKACHDLVQRVEQGEMEHLEQFVDELAEVPLRYQPGERYAYSYSTDVLGRVVEVVSGMPLGRFFEKELFRPLGMRDTGFSFSPSKGSRLAALYASRNSAVMLGAKRSSLSGRQGALCRIDGMLPEESRWAEGGRCRIDSGGGMMGANMGGLVSTVADCSRFVAMLACGGHLGGARILRTATVKRYCLPDLLPECISTGKQQRANGAPFGWTALGEVGVPRSARDAPPSSKDNFEIGEVGGGGAACTYWSVNPNRRLATVWFTQSMDNDPYIKDEENLYLAARTAVPIVPVEPVPAPMPLPDGLSSPEKEARAKRRPGALRRSGSSPAGLQRKGSAASLASAETPSVRVRKSIEKPKAAEKPPPRPSLGGVA